jgi:hypothetical protein
MLSSSGDAQQGPNSAVPLVAISFYDRRNTDCLQALLTSMAAHEAGTNFDVLIVVNRTRDERIGQLNAPFPFEVAYRENLGMNIGAWDNGWRLHPDRPVYLFLQDECLIVRENWLRAFVDRCMEPNVGLVGESFNPAWDAPWTRLAAMHAASRLPDHFIDGRRAARVDSYLHHMARWGVDPGQTGRHLRSIVWAANGEALRRIDGFPLGTNYGECIAAEIAVSRKMEKAGLDVVQVSQSPFHFVRHREWNQDLPGGEFYHAQKPVEHALNDCPKRVEYDAEALRIHSLLGDAPDGGDIALLITALMCKLEDRDRQIQALRNGAQRPSR